MKRTILAVAACLLTCLPLVAEPSLSLKGPKGAQTFTRADYDSLPPQQLQVETQTWSGVSLYEVLQKVGAPSVTDMRGAAVRSYVVVTGNDGYRAVFSLAELDSSMRERGALLNYDPKTDTFRLAVPGDRLRSRWVRSIEAIQLEQIERRGPKGGE